MVPRLSQPNNVNVLISNANWAWPQAVEEIFQPRGVNALVANSADDTVHLVDHSKIHLAILDMGYDELSGMHTLRIIRQHDQLLPCILLAQKVNKHILAEALILKAFSVLDKPVDLQLLEEQIDRLFLKYYASELFSNKNSPDRCTSEGTNKRTRRKTTIFKWSLKRNERSDR